MTGHTWICRTVSRALLCACCFCFTTLINGHRLHAQTEAPYLAHSEIKHSYTTKIALDVCLIDSELFPLWRASGEEHHEKGGINIDLMRHIADELDFSINWVRAPFARCLKMLQNGEVDALNVASYSRTRLQYGLYPTKGQKVDPDRRFKMDAYAGFVRSDSKINFNGNTFENINKMPVAIEIGASILPNLKKMDLEVLQLPDIDHAFKMLEANRISMVVTNHYNGARYQDHDIRRLSPNIEEKPYYLMLSRKFFSEQEAFALAIWQACQDLQETTYERVVNYYSSLATWPKNNEVNRPLESQSQSNKD